LPREHDLGCAVVARGDIACHLDVADPCEAKVADLEVAVLVDEHVARFEVAVDDVGRVHVLRVRVRLSCERRESATAKRAASRARVRSRETYLERPEDLIEEVLNMGHVQGLRDNDLVQVRTQQLCDKVQVVCRGDENVLELNDLRGPLPRPGRALAVSGNGLPRPHRTPACAVRSHDACA